MSQYRLISKEYSSIIAHLEENLIYIIHCMKPAECVDHFMYSLKANRLWEEENFKKRIF